MSKQTFDNAVSELGLEWQAQDVTGFFDQVNMSQRSGQYREIDARTIDETVHWLCRRKLSEIHHDLLVQVAIRTT